MESFDLQTDIPDGAGLNDKISLQIKGWLLRGELLRFQQRLCVPPSGVPYGAHPGVYGCVFEGAQTLEDDARPKNWLAVRSLNSKSVLVPRPSLFSGKLLFLSCGSGLTEITAILSLNPTRFVHHYYNRWVVGDVSRVEYPLRRGDVRSEYNGESVLDSQSDNWIPWIRPHGRYTRPENWRPVLRRYIVHVVELIRSELRRACGAFLVGGTDGLQRESLNFNLQSVETYVEYGCSDPILAANKLGSLFESFGESSDSTVLQGPMLDLNSKCFRVEVSRGEKLKLYAKTNRRIRIEVEHTLNDDGASLLSPHTFESIEGVLEGIEAMRQRSRNLMDAFRLHVVASLSRPSWSPSPLEFIQQVHLHAQEPPSGIGTLISLLVTNGGIRLPGKHPLLPALRKLKAAGILRFDSRGKRYLPTAQYLYAVDFLRTRMIDVQFLAQGVRSRSRPPKL